MSKPLQLFTTRRYGPHRETHYTQWWAPRQRGTHHLYEAFYDLIPRYVEVRDEAIAQSYQAAIDADDLSIEDLKQQSWGRDAGPTRSSEERRGSEVVHLPGCTGRHHTRRVAHTTRSGITPWSETLVCEVVIPSQDSGGGQGVSDSATPKRELTVTDVVGILVRTVHTSCVLKPGAHNTMVYERKALEVLEEYKVPAHIKDKVLPAFREAVWWTTSREEQAIRVSNTRTAERSKVDAKQILNRWRGWFLWSVAGPRPGLS